MLPIAGRQELFPPSGGEHGRALDTEDAHGGPPEAVKRSLLKTHAGRWRPHSRRDVLDDVPRRQHPFRIGIRNSDLKRLFNAEHELD